MGLLKTITEEYLGGLEYVQEIHRDISLLGAGSDILALTGPRRVGKTFTLLKHVSSLLKAGQSAIYAAFDDPSLVSLSVRDFAELVRADYPSGSVSLFLDEIQEWENWDRKVRWLHDVKDFQIYISGSSSALLSSEMPSRLRGRYISRTILPFSFSEVCGTNGQQTFRETGKLRRCFDEYLQWGGFPEVWTLRSREKTVSILDTMFYRDIVERHGVTDIMQFREAFHFILKNYSNPLTWNSMRKMMHLSGLDLDTKTVIRYVNSIASSYLIFLNYRFSFSQREMSVSPKKIYLVDPGIATVYAATPDVGRRIENLVYLQLLRMGGSINYYTTRDGKEIDFIYSEGQERKLVEVCVQADSDHVGRVRRALSESGAQSALILTLEDNLRQEGRIRVMPLHRWLAVPVL